jgi:F420H(2)-dependent quinone reductase
MGRIARLGAGFWRWTTRGPKWHYIAGIIAPLVAMLTLLGSRKDRAGTPRVRRETRPWKVAAAVHLYAYKLTRGRLGGHLTPLQIQLLTTEGRKTHRERTTPLTYLRHGDSYVLVASNGGRDFPPIWYRNLQANPRAAIQIYGRKLQVVARTADDAEREELWQKVVSLWDGYVGYQLRTDRRIPLVILSPETIAGS